MNLNDTSFLLNMDALKGMALIPSSTVDLVLTDPPYNICQAGKVTKSKGKIVSNQDAWGNDFKDEWETVDDYWNWLKPFITEMVRVMKDGASMILFLDRKYTGLIAYFLETQFELTFKNKMYFIKTNALPSFRFVNYRSNIEECLWFSKGKAENFNFGTQQDMLQTFTGSIGKKFKLNGMSHPTEKYGWMIEPLILNHSQPGQTVLDVFSGSGSVMVHALRNGRKSIGFEMNKDFFEIAKARAAHENLNIYFGE